MRSTQALWQRLPAGLHFTEALLKELREKGVDIEYVTLHVGAGTFQPVRVDNIAEHHMHSEWYHLPEDVAARVNQAKKEGRRVIAVGTTSLRTLESAATEVGHVEAGSRDTALFITPGYEYRIVDALITNFHLPKSTLVMLVSALVGRSRILEAYRHAVEEKYRFFSYGDACFIRKDKTSCCSNAGLRSRLMAFSFKVKTTSGRARRGELDAQSWRGANPDFHARGNLRRSEVARPI